MGKHYTEEEKSLITELTLQGLTDEAIAQKLDRSTNSVRNIRYRNNIKTQATQTIQQLKQDKQKLTQQTQQLEYKLRQLERTRNQYRKALQKEDQALRNKLETELIRLKTKKPELFYITDQEQMAQLTAQLTTSIIRWLMK
jgi:transposase